MRKIRVKKTPSERFADCEAHVFFLWDARRLYADQPERFKQIAAELRVLVCRTKSNKPLLLDLMDEYGFSYEVQPPGLSESGPPLKPQPLAMVGWREDPTHVELTRLLAEAIEAGDSGKMDVVDRRLSELARPIPFREWIDQGLSVYIAPHDYSHRDLILAIAQQFGSSHEDESVEEPILHMRQLYIGGERGDLAPLTRIADSVLVVGMKFILHLVKSHGFEPRYFSVDAL